MATETNTFHFMWGEKTIALEDVSYPYGLAIDGKPVIGPVWSNRSSLEDTCSILLGIKVDGSAYLRGGQLSLTWIRRKFKILRDGFTAADKERYARAFLFHLVRSQLCTNNAGARGHAYILEHFEDFDRYAWGPTCLASVYRSMTRATQIKDCLRTITGPLHLLQIWAYSHTAVGRPLRGQLDALCFEFPLFKMWQNILKPQSISSTISECRDELNQSDYERIVDQPYLKWAEQLDAIVDEQDRSIFHSTAPLIYY